MNADIKGALKKINKCYHLFEHKGKSMTFQQVKLVLEYGITKGYEHTGQLTDEEVETIINETEK